VTIGIFIPTKNRPEKLASCLESCAKSLAQNVKFIVLDNASEKSTELAFEVVSHDSRFEYRRYDLRGSINEQFIRAANLASAFEWVSIIGDDDAVCPGGLDRLCEFLEENKGELGSIDNVLWDRPIYRWSDYAESERGLLSYSVSGSPGLVTFENSTSYMPSNSSQTVKVIYEAPGIYHRLVRTSLLDTLFAKYPDTIFAHSADISFGAHNALEGTNCIRVSYPVTLLGYSGNSTGSAFSVNDDKAIREIFFSENRHYIRIFETAFERYCTPFFSESSFVPPPITEVSTTFMILNEVLQSRGMRYLSLDLYLKSEVLNLPKVGPGLRLQFEKFLLSLFSKNPKSIPSGLIDICRSAATPRSLGSPGTSITLSENSSVELVQQTLRLPAEAAMTACTAARLVESLSMSLSRISIR
jgi:glycosyltransferase involved in cell wall biosynthesis